MNTSIIQSQPTIALPEKPYPFAKINNKAICVALKSVNENFSKETFNKLEIALKILIENNEQRAETVALKILRASIKNPGRNYEERCFIYNLQENVFDALMDQHHYQQAIRVIVALAEEDSKKHPIFKAYHYQPSYSVNDVLYREILSKANQIAKSTTPIKLTEEEIESRISQVFLEKKSIDGSVETASNEPASNLVEFTSDSVKTSNCFSCFSTLAEPGCFSVLDRIAEVFSQVRDKIA